MLTVETQTTGAQERKGGVGVAIFIGPVVLISLTEVAVMVVKAMR